MTKEEILMIIALPFLVVYAILEIALIIKFWFGD